MIEIRFLEATRFLISLAIARGLVLPLALKNSRFSEIAKTGIEVVV